MLCSRLFLHIVKQWIRNIKWEMYNCVCQYWHAICLYKFYCLSDQHCSSFHISFLRNGSSIWGLSIRFHDKLHCSCLPFTYAHRSTSNHTVCSSISTHFPWTQHTLPMSNFYLHNFPNSTYVMEALIRSIHESKYYHDYSRYGFCAHSLFKHLQILSAYASEAAYVCNTSIHSCFTKNLWQIQGPTFLSGW